MADLVERNEIICDLLGLAESIEYDEGITLTDYRHVSDENKNGG
jgi:hypothetical protein